MIERGIRQDNTWLVVDPIVGCAHDCQYCFLRLYEKTKQRGLVTMTPQQAVEKLVNYWAFKDTSMVMIGSETDMFMNAENIGFLSEFVKIYNDYGIKNPLSLSTKCYIPDKFIKLAQTLKDTNIIFYISYSGLPKEIEPYINKEKVKLNFERLASAGQNIIHFWRPMIPQNSTKDVVERIMLDVHKYASCSVMRGLNLNKDLQKQIWFWPELRDSKIDYSKIVSSWPDELNKNIMELMIHYPNYPLFFKNSCAMAYVLKTPEFVGIYGSDRCQRSWCPDSQRLICKTFNATQQFPTQERVIDELKKMDVAYSSVTIDRNGRKIVIKGIMNHEQVACLSQILRCKLDVEIIASKHEWGGYVLGHNDQSVASS